jgi:HK97 family phage prohead protease
MTTAVLERWTFASQPIEFRSAGEGKIQAAGYGAVFNKRSQNLGGFYEQIAPGAFAKTIQEQDVRALFNHDPNALLGRLSAGTLRLTEDGTGLAYEIDLPDTTTGRDVAAMLERRDLSGSSIGFKVVEQEAGLTEQDFPLRTLKQVSLRDVGPVTFPAYVDTDAALRSLAEFRSVDYETVRAADPGELRTLIFAPKEREEPQDEERSGDGRETPTVTRLLRPAGWY